MSGSLYGKNILDIFDESEACHCISNWMEFIDRLWLRWCRLLELSHIKNCKNSDAKDHAPHWEDILVGKNQLECTSHW